MAKPRGLKDEKIAFYQALADNPSAKEALKDDDLKKIARELAESIKRKATLDWTQRDTVCADMRRTVRRLLARYGYPPDAQEAAHGEQCYEWDLVVDEWGYEVTTGR